MMTDRWRPQRGCPMKDMAGQEQASHHQDHKPWGGRRGTENRNLPWMSTRGNQTFSVGAFSGFGPHSTARRRAGPAATGGGPCPNSASGRQLTLPSPGQEGRQRAAGAAEGGMVGTEAFVTPPAMPPPPGLLGRPSGAGGGRRQAGKAAEVTLLTAQAVTAPLALRCRPHGLVWFCPVSKKCLSFKTGCQEGQPTLPQRSSALAIWRREEETGAPSNASGAKTSGA